LGILFEQSAIDTLRHCVLARAEHRGIASLAEQIGIWSLGQLEDFAHGRGAVPPAAVVHALTAAFLPDYTWEESSDSLKRRPPKTLRFGSAPLNQPVVTNCPAQYRGKYHTLRPTVDISEL
jgi:hypothetical protein